MVAVCAAAGVITAMTTKTGLGAQFSSVLVGGVDAITDNRTLMLALTAVFAAVALAMLGLAIPVTASFVIGWVIIGPALLALDVPAPAAAMFVFYYSVLSEVTPPTALAAVGASAVTGGRAIPTMWQALRYAAPAFLVPIAFVLTDPGEYLLGRGPVLGVLWAWPRRRARASWRCPFAAGGWVLGVGAMAPIAADSRRRCGPAVAIPRSRHHRGGIGVSARCSRAHHHPTRGDGHETCDDGVRGAGLTGAAATGCGGRQDAPSADSGGEITCEVGSDTRVSIATGNATGVYFSLGNAYAEQISAATDGKVKATAAETGASVQNIQQLVGGSYQVAFSLADTRGRRCRGQRQLRR